MKRKKMFRGLTTMLLAAVLLVALLPVTSFSSEIVAEGTCSNEDVTWSLDSDGTLTLSGEGHAGDYSDMERPWEDYADQITSIVVEDGVNELGEWIFAGLTNVESVSIASSVWYYGQYSFYGCTSLTSITISGGEDGYVCIDSAAFLLCTALTSVTFDDTVYADICEAAFNGCTSLNSLSVTSGYIAEYALGGTALTSDDIYTTDDLYVSLNAFGDYEEAEPSYDEAAENVAEITLDEEETGEIEEADAFAYYSFTPEEDGTYYIYTTGEDDTVLYLYAVYDSDWEEVSYDDDSGKDWNAYIIEDLSAGQTYYIVFGFYSYDQTGEYTLIVSDEENPDPYDSSDVDLDAAAETATVITLNEVVEYSVEDAYSDEDGCYNYVYYSFTPDEDGRYYIYTFGSDCDPFLYLYNADGICKGYDDDSGNDENGNELNAYIIADLEGGVTYYIAAAFYGQDDAETYSSYLTVSDSINEYALYVGAEAEYVTENVYEMIEGIDSWTYEDTYYTWDDDEDAYVEVTYAFEYYEFWNIDDISEEDTIVVTLADGTEITYYFDSESYSFYDEDGNELSFYQDSDDQYYDPWEAGGEYEITLCLDGSDTAVYVPVVIVENPYENATTEFIPAEGHELSMMETADSYVYEYWYWDDETEEEICIYVENYYDFWNLVEEGDQIVITLEDGSTIEYTFSEESWSFVTEDGDELRFYQYDDAQVAEAWEAGNTYEMVLYLEDYGLDVSLEVYIEEYPIADVVYVTDNEYVFVEGEDALTYTIWYSDDESYTVVYYYYSYLDGLADSGDTIVITMADGEEITLYLSVVEYNGYLYAFFFNNDIGFLVDQDLMDQYEETWEVGEHVMTLILCLVSGDFDVDTIYVELPVTLVSAASVDDTAAEDGSGDTTTDTGSDDTTADTGSDDTTTDTDSDDTTTDTGSDDTTADSGSDDDTVEAADTSDTFPLGFYVVLLFAAAALLAAMGMKMHRSTR